MYPKVKVRGLGHDVVYDRHYHQASKSPLQGLKAFDSLFDGDFGPTAKEPKDVSPQLVAKVPSCCIPASFTPPPSSDSKGVEENEKEAEEGLVRPHIRASPIPRPRAVLSSPVNDELIGNKTKSSVERQLNLKGHDSTGRSKHCKSVVTKGMVLEEEECKDGEKSIDAKQREASPMHVRVRKRVTVKR